MGQNGVSNFFKQFEITLFHSTMFAVIHPMERLGGLAEVAAIVASYGSHLNLHALRDLSDVVNDGFRFLWFPRGRRIIVLPHLVSTRKKKSHKPAAKKTKSRARAYESAKPVGKRSARMKSGQCH
jgi:hypothetical protein